MTRKPAKKISHKKSPKKKAQPKKVKTKLPLVASLEEIVFALVYHTANLELQKDQFVELAPVQGMCGNARLSGNSLPSFLYTVFDKKLMEFISVTAEVSKPDRIQFISHITGEDPKTHGKEVEVKDQYIMPFFILANHLYRYFPLVRKAYLA